MTGAWLFERMAQTPDAIALATHDGDTSYRTLLDRVAAWDERLASNNVVARVLSIEGDYGVESIALFLAAMKARNVIIPVCSGTQANLEDYLEIGEAECRIVLRPDGADVIQTGRVATHQHYRNLRLRQTAGLVLFSSGSTGASKAAVHDLSPLLEKFATPRHRYRTLVFLQLDHIGGINTLLYTLANAGTVVVAAGRMPLQVCEAIARHRVDLLPTSPTFLNLLLLSEEWQRHDLSSLQVITYGTEPMPLSTLQRVHAAFPNVRLQQTYGLSELGILRSQSRGPDSLWVRVGGEGYETKVIDGRLWIRAKSAMLGYLNAPSPFDADGFFDTNDLVEVDGEWLRILGRQSDIINVGGNKVFPMEVENVLLQMTNVEDAAVRAEPNALTGQAVVVSVRLGQDEDQTAFKTRMRVFCRQRLDPYKIPVRVEFHGPVYSERFKKMRNRAAAS
jgi:acyl-CoA synthetase (AMP-forming)/AMP-acid ligase II